MLSYIHNVFSSIFIHAMDEIFMSEIKKKKQFHTAWFPLNSYKCQVSCLKFEIFPISIKDRFPLEKKTISKIDFSKLITDTRKATLLYEKWNNIPHYTQTEINGRGPCEPSLTSYYAHHSQFSINQNLINIPSHSNPKENSSPK